MHDHATEYATALSGAMSLSAIYAVPITLYAMLSGRDQTGALIGYGVHMGPLLPSVVSGYYYHPLVTFRGGKKI